MKLLSKFESLSRSKLNKIAIVLSILTILWNLAEGVVSVCFGAENESVSLVFFGIDSFVEVTSSFADAIVTLVRNGKPDTTISGLIISSVTIFFMALLWLMKFSIAKLLNSSTMMSDSKCTLSCIQITLVLFLSSLIYSVWNDGWWIDSVAALILGLLFSKEGIGMILWAKSKDFDECKITITSEKIVDNNNIKEEGQ
ncbi:10659_t:CDS:2 [Cetraspora pellucida]|uniref:10659_t:CDS:1 n=1 Tax=Cetraspora pellucida TaxID=1433469 RepID=A0A9N9CFS8_9GLOM|nr:10659_t:CDS:2 [Cetraspora pellucida]